MRHSTCLLMLLLAAGRVGADVRHPFALGIRLRVDPSVAARNITDRVKSEAATIWGPYGIQIEWIDADSGSGAGGATLDASLERRLEAPRRFEVPTVLGRAVVNADSPNGSPIRVSLDATESLLALRPTSGTSMAGIVPDHELARALGRVLAHEIGHALLGPPYHDRAGLMRAGFRAEELGDASRRPFRLTCDSVGRLGSRLRGFAAGARLVRTHDSTSLELEDVATKAERSRGASCITVHTPR